MAVSKPVISTADTAIVVDENTFPIELIKTTIVDENHLLAETFQTNCC